MSSTPQLEDGFTMLANELVERVLGFGFSHREQSIIFTIFRKTYGYGKKEDDMSASQIGDMCKIARQHVTSTLNVLALRNVINKRPGRYGSIIGIQKDHRRWITAEQMKALPASPESGQAGPSEGEGGGVAPVPNKDTCPELGLVPNQDRWIVPIRDTQKKTFQKKTTKRKSLALRNRNAIRLTTYQQARTAGP